MLRRRLLCFFGNRLERPRASALLGGGAERSQRPGDPAPAGKALRQPREHVRSFDRREDAIRFETDLRRRKQLGELVETDDGQETLDEWAREWFASYAQPNLAGHTLAYYARAWDIHVLPRLGELELRRLTPAVVAGFADELRRDGVGDPTIRKVLSLLQSVLSRAVVLGKITANPVAAIRKPAQRRGRAVKPLDTGHGRTAPAGDPR